MEIKTSIIVRPFSVPERVSVEVTSEHSRKNPILPTMKLSELSEETLSLLCDDFRTNVFELAGKIDPKKTKPSGD